MVPPGDAGKAQGMSDYPLLSMNGFETPGQKRERYLRAWKEARKASAVLKERFDAQEVLLFGSLLDEDAFASHSDIDLAVQNMPVSLFYQAHSLLIDTIEGFDFDLVDMNACKPEVLESILATGVKL